MQDFIPKQLSLNFIDGSYGTGAEYAVIFFTDRLCHWHKVFLFKSRGIAYFPFLLFQIYIFVKR